MSYEQNWGFTDSTDEYGVKISLNDSDSRTQSREENDFIVEIKLSNEVKHSYQSCRDELRRNFQIFRITSDFEPISSLLVKSTLR